MRRGLACSKQQAPPQIHPCRVSLGSALKLCQESRANSKLSAHCCRPYVSVSERKEGFAFYARRSLMSSKERSNCARQIRSVPFDLGRREGFPLRLRPIFSRCPCVVTTRSPYSRRRKVLVVSENIPSAKRAQCCRFRENAVVHERSPSRHSANNQPHPALGQSPHPSSHQSAA